MGNSFKITLKSVVLGTKFTNSFLKCKKIPERHARGKLFRKLFTSLVEFAGRVLLNGTVRLNGLVLFVKPACTTV
jgi:hypothetical protein